MEEERIREALLGLHARGLLDWDVTNAELVSLGLEPMVRTWKVSASLDGSEPLAWVDGVQAEDAQEAIASVRASLDLRLSGLRLAFEGAEGDAAPMAAVMSALAMESTLDEARRAFCAQVLDALTYVAVPS